MKTTFKKTFGFVSVALICGAAICLALTTGCTKGDLPPNYNVRFPGGSITSQTLDMDLGQILTVRDEKPEPGYGYRDYSDYGKTLEK